MEDPETLYKQAQSAHYSGNYDQALSIIEQAEANVGEHTDLGLRVRITIEHANLLRLAGREKEALTALNWVLALIHSERSDEVEEAATAFYIVRAYMEFAAAARNTDDLDIDAVLALLVDAHLGVDDIESARDAAGEILRLARARKRRGTLALALLDNVDVALAADELDEAAELIERARTPALEADEHLGSTRHVTELTERLELLRRKRRVADLQERLASVAVEKTKMWWENYLKHVIEFRGVKMASNRTTTKTWVREHELEGEELVETALLLLAEELAEDKLAGILVFESYFVEDSGFDPMPLVDRFARLFEKGHIYDWNTCDWFCVKVLGKFAATHGERFARAVMAWSTAAGVWQRRAAGVAFVNLASRGDEFFDGFTDLLLGVCADTVQSDERFAQTGTGWVLRELGLAERDRVLRFVDEHRDNFSAEGLRYALEKMPDELEKRR